MGGKLSYNLGVFGGEGRNRFNAAFHKPYGAVLQSTLGREVGGSAAAGPARRRSRP